MDEKETPPETPAADTTPTDDLDALLADIQASDADPEKQPEPEPEPKADAADDARNARFDAFIEKQDARDVRTELNTVVESMKTAAPALKNLPDVALRGFLEESARESPAIRTAWQQRGSDPDRWNKVAEGLAKQLGSQLEKQPDPDLTGDRVAAEEFVNSQAVEGGADDKIPEQSKLAAMSVEELKQLNRSLSTG